jgi:hypothetical protein
MRHLILLGAAVALGACASANRIERGADADAARAKQLAHEGQWKEASKLQAKAEKETSKANTRRGFEDVMPIVFH